MKVKNEDIESILLRILDRIVLKSQGFIFSQLTCFEVTDIAKYLPKSTQNVIVSEKSNNTSLKRL